MSGKEHHVSDLVPHSDVELDDYSERAHPCELGKGSDFA